MKKIILLFVFLTGVQAGFAAEIILGPGGSYRTDGNVIRCEGVGANRFRSDCLCETYGNNFFYHLVYAKTEIATGKVDWIERYQVNQHVPGGNAHVVCQQAKKNYHLCTIGPVDTPN